MKKKILLSLASAFVVMGVGAASASAAPAQTDVTGVITNSAVAVAGADVTVICNGNTQTDTTDVHGAYLAVFPIAQCQVGDIVKVMAQKGGDSGATTGPVNGVTTKLNLAIVNVSIPEYGLIGALTAGSAGIGLIAFMRRRQQSQM